MKLTLHLALRSRVAKSWPLASPAKARTTTAPKRGSRRRDLIKIGGEWVSPIQIENALVEHDAVSEAAVVAVTMDNALRIKATLVLCANRDGTVALTRELQEWCKARLQRYQYPHVIDYVDDLPKTVTGKVQRFKLRERIE